MLSPIEKAADEPSLFVSRSCTEEWKAQRLKYRNESMRSKWKMMDEDYELCLDLSVYFKFVLPHLNE